MELFSPAHLLLLFLVIVLLFGGKKIPEVMKGLGEGIRNFKEGMAGTPHPPAPPAQAPPAAPAEKPAEEKK
jgi:sec-independent protein translocase protein TatA